MKASLFVGVALSATLAATAMAADMAVKAPVRPLPPPAPIPTWTGCYINGGGGYGMWNQDMFLETDPGHVTLSTTVTNGGRGWFGTVGAGCDYQVTPNIVIGVLGDFDFMNIHGSMQTPLINAIGDENERWAWAVGGRVGWLVTPGLLAYVDGGYTQTRFDEIDANRPFAQGAQGAQGQTIINFAPAVSQFVVPAHTYTGWFVGGGTEYNLGWIPGLFWRSEYRFASYRPDDISILFAPSGTLSGEAVNSKKFVQTVRSELVWRFNWTGAASVAARY